MMTQFERINIVEDAKDLEWLTRGWTYVVKNSSKKECFKVALDNDLWISAELNYSDNIEKVVCRLIPITELKPRHIAEQLKYADIGENQTVYVQGLKYSSIVSALHRNRLTNVKVTDMPDSNCVMLSAKKSEDTLRSYWLSNICIGKTFGLQKDISASDRNFIYSKAKMYGFKASIYRTTVFFDSKDRSPTAMITNFVNSMANDSECELPESFRNFDSMIIRNTLSKMDCNAFYRNGKIIKRTFAARNQGRGVVILRGNETICRFDNTRVSKLTNKQLKYIDLMLMPFGITHNEVFGL